jgi:hypothetical protein
MKLTPDDLNDICRATVGAVQGAAPASLNDEQLDTFNAAGERMFFAAVDAVNTSMTQDEAAAAAHAAASIQHDADTKLDETPISDEISAFYDSRRLTEADVDHLAEIYSEGRIFNRNSIRTSHE